MKTVPWAMTLCVALCGTTAAWGQYGLYGSPETLSISPQETGYSADSAPASYPATTTPSATAYAPQPAYQPMPFAPQQPYPPYLQPYPSYQPAAPQGYSYPAQPAAVGAYQPYQPGAQYRYPGPAVRPSMRTAALEPPAALPPPAAMPVAPRPYDPLAPQSPSVMNQMLPAQTRGGGCDCGVYRGAVGCDEQAACGQACCDSQCPWYASVTALVLSRTDGRRMWFACDGQQETHQLADSQFPMAWRWGGEARFGRRFCCGCVPYALEARYWTFDAFTGYRNIQASSLPAGHTIDTILNMNYLNFGGVAYNHWFKGADAVTLDRRNECHNVEINLVREQLAWASDSPWDIGWSIGVRYFRFQEELTYGSLAGGYDPNNPANWAYFSDNIANNLIGAQFGFDAAYNLCPSLRVFIAPQVGIYNTYMQGKFRVETGDGIPGRSPQFGAYPVSSNKNGIAFLTQIDMGVDWQFTRNWSARAGYRVVAVTGLALADAQFPQYIIDKPEGENIQHYARLVLHGAFLGLTYNF